MNSKKINYVDFNYKILFMFFITHILKILGIDEEVDEILYNESITMQYNDILDIIHHIMDFPVKTKSGKILLFEFKKDILKRKDFKQLFEYFKDLSCDGNKEVIPIMITIPKGGNIKSYSTPFFEFKPLVFKTKTFDIQKDLLTIQNKFNNNEMLSDRECSVLVALPFFESGEDEGEIIEEFCHYIKKNRENIPKDNLKYIIMGLYLGIVGFVDEEKQDDLMEMINMTTVYKGAVEELQKEAARNAERKGERKGERNGQRRIISRLLKNSSYCQVAKQLEMTESEVRRIMRRSF